MRFFTAGLVSALAAMATAYTTPDYSVSPSGNPILTPSLQEQVAAGSPYTITWDPTTEGTVSLVLLRGPSTNVLPLYALAESIPNTGSFEWTPSTELEADVTHYGLLLVVESGPDKGAYQWSTQFGISNPTASSSSTTTTTTTAAATTTTTTDAASTTEPAAESTITKTATITTTECPETATVPAGVKPTGVYSSSIIPTLSQSPSSAVWTPTFTPAPPQFTGAAGRNAISLGAVAAGVAAVLAF
ncbi:Ser-Thr-rich glycosyl-phosphatidyl-inositol-anchored membrane family-domain-containing protein [Aspergillus varians]